MKKLQYKALTIPKLSWNSKTLTSTYGELVAQPLEPGFGITIGNALRRMLLAAVEGSAVTSVIIKGVNNEFSTVPGIVEDTMQLVLNLKQIVVRNNEGKPGTMRLKVTGEAVARVADIIADEHLELINPEHVIAHVAPKAELDIQFFVEPGRAYQQAQWPHGKQLQEDDRIYLDAMFSPVRQVQMDVQKTRVGKDIDYDKLTLTIHTNGAQTPTEVLHYAVSVLRTQLEHFLEIAEIPFNDISAAQQPVAAPKALPSTSAPERHDPLVGMDVDLLLKPITELELSARAQNCLESHGIKRILDLANLTEEEGLKIKNFGRKSLNEVKEAMENVGLHFGMGLNESDVINAVESKHIDNEDEL